MELLRSRIRSRSKLEHGRAFVDRKRSAHDDNVSKPEMEPFSLRLLSVTVFVTAETEPWIWSRYIAGLSEFVRASKIQFPGWRIILMLGDQTKHNIRGYPEWTKILDAVTNDSLVTTHLFDQSIPKEFESLVEHRIYPLHHRFTPLLMYPAADVIAFRDADSPPTRSDRNAVFEWLRSCKERPLLVYTLPMIGVTRCGGGITLRPRYIVDELPVSEPCQLTKLAYESVKSKLTVWGVDERLFDQLKIGSSHNKCEVECFHHPDTLAYYTALDFTLPLIDRLDDKCSADCHLNMVRCGKCCCRKTRNTRPAACLGVKWVASNKGHRLHPMGFFAPEQNAYASASHHLTAEKVRLLYQRK
jgi:hypothetical protein